MESSVANSRSESAPLLHQKAASLYLKYTGARKCMSSRSAILILFWSFLVGLWNGVALSPDFYLLNFLTLFPYTLVAYGFLACLTILSPLAGYLADLKFGRYKMVIGSLFILWLTLPIGAVASIVLWSITSILNLINAYNYVLASLLPVVTAILSIGVLGFDANVIQFGMDQLHDSPGEDRSIFIHWYVWQYYLSLFFGQLAWNLSYQIPYNLMQNTYYSYAGYSLLGLIPLSVAVCLPVTLCLAKHRKKWFLIEPGKLLNPYKLVYRVTRFSWQHKTPVNRSAFTYCEDEVPKGLDLAKEKYGGCFTTEEVEDVKVFYGILKVLFGFGGVFFLDFAANSILPLYALHTTPYHMTVPNPMYYYVYNGTLVEHIFLNCGLLSPLLVVVCIPVFVYAIHPFLIFLVPRTLKKMGLGLFLTLLSIIVSFSMDAKLHLSGGQHDKSVCMLTDLAKYYFDQQAIPQSSWFLAVQLTLSALSHMLIYISVFEFICSQSPQTMKGLLIGLFYAIRGVYQAMATLLVVPFTTGLLDSVFPSCGFYYYLVNIVLGVAALFVYVRVARRYHYRERDEPSHIHRYAEEYYSNTQQELYYDYD